MRGRRRRRKRSGCPWWQLEEAETEMKNDE